MSTTVNYDIAIIGGGPAGYTAALYAGRAGYRAVVCEKASPGGQMGVTSTIENYPGFASVAGFQLAANMMEQASGFGAEFLYDEIISVELAGREKIVRTADTEVHCRAVILATGAKPRLLGVPGEEEYTGRGVSYCATCDGMFFRGKTVVISGGGDTAFEDAVYLSNMCKEVILVHRRDAFRANASSIRKAKAKDNISFVLNARITEVRGNGQAVDGVVIQDTVTGESRVLAADGVFVAVGRTPDTALFEGQIALENGYIVADETTRTSVDGVFAAGDVRTKPLRQVVTACADGATAVKFAEEWMEE